MDSHTDWPAVEVRLYDNDPQSIDRSAHDLETGKIAIFRTQKRDN